MRPQLEGDNVDARLAIIDTSQRVGWVAVARGETLLASRRLDEARRHARDLAPALAELLAEQGWRARQLEGIVVSRGPGSYTGLRVGIMSAKTLAYVIGCPLVGVDTFAAIARQSPPDVHRVDVLADAQQDKVYLQRFLRSDYGSWTAEGELTVVPFEEWRQTKPDDSWASGPAVETFRARITAPLTPEVCLLPRPESVLSVGLERLHAGERDDPMALEPLYLRPSSAETNFKR
jgi:tRNA threonylcarbamoyladenosine biosynthesis protein TsaB